MFWKKNDIEKEANANNKNQRKGFPAKASSANAENKKIKNSVKQ